MSDYTPKFTHGEDCAFDEEHVFLEEEVMMLREAYAAVYEMDGTANPVLIGIRDDHSALCISVMQDPDVEPELALTMASTYFAFISPMLKGVVMALPAIGATMEGSKCEPGTFYRPKDLDDQPYMRGFNVGGMFKEEGFTHFTYFNALGTADDGSTFWYEPAMLGEEDGDLMPTLMRHCLTFPDEAELDELDLGEDLAVMYESAMELRERMEASGMFMFAEREME